MMSVNPDKEGAEIPQSGSDRAGFDVDTDEVLAYDAGNGDIRAFEILVTRYEKFVYKSAYYVTGKPEDAADLVQEIFLGLWRGLPSYRRDAKFFTYFARITRNACADWVRKRKNIPGMLPIAEKDEDDAPDAVLPAAPEDTSPELVTEQNERRQQLHRAIAALSEEHRTVIVLRDMEGYSYDQIAGLLGVDEGTVKSRLFRARKRLKVILEKQGFFP